MQNGKVKIEIWSDVVCPFCFIGKKRIEETIEKLQAQDKVEVIWHSYQLDPGFPKDTSALYYPYHYKRSGYTEAQLKPMGARLNYAGKPYGIEYNFEEVLVVNSLELHRLLLWSKKYDLYNQLNEALMLAYFTHGVDLSKVDKVMEIVARVGLNVDEARNMLATDAYIQAVQADIQRAYELGISGVPYFLINGKDKISGAQDSRVFERVISAAIAAQALLDIPSEGGMCTPDANCKID